MIIERKNSQINWKWYLDKILTNFLRRLKTKSLNIINFGNFLKYVQSCILFQGWWINYVRKQWIPKFRFLRPISYKNVTKLRLARVWFYCYPKMITSTVYVQNTYHQKALIFLVSRYCYTYSERPCLSSGAIHADITL